MADRNRNDTFKSLKNPLLTNAALSFPFENISSSALLVPQPQADTSLLSDGEVDSFLGQDAPPKSSTFSSVIKPPSSQVPPSAYVPTLNPGHGSTVPFDLSAQANNYYNPLISSPICTPIVTNSFLGQSSESKTVSSAPSVVGYNPTTLPSSLSSNSFYDQQPTNNVSSVLNPTVNPQSFSNPSSFNYFYGNQSSLVSSQVTQDNASSSVLFHQSSAQPVNLTSPFNPSLPTSSPSSFTPTLPGIDKPPIVSNSDFPFSSPAVVSSASSPPTTSVPLSAPPPVVGLLPVSTPDVGPVKFYQTSPVKTEDYNFNPVNSSFFQPVPAKSVSPNLGLAPTDKILQSNSTPPLVTGFDIGKPTSAPFLQITPLTGTPPIQTYNPNYHQGNVPISAPAPVPGLVHDQYNVTGTSKPAATSSAPPKGGGLSNTYRLGNLKRPAYAPPPDLSVTASPNMATAVPNPVLPPQNASSLFTPICTNNMNSNDVTDLGTSTASSSAPIFSGGSSSSTTDLSTNPTLPSYQSPVTNQAAPATVLPPSEAPSLPQGQMYRPPYHHWFFKKEIEGKVIWQPFSMADSLKLEEAFTSLDISPDTKVATDGGRYDVDVLRRQRVAIYWKEEPGEVRRCSWFVKGTLDSRYTPYEEKISTKLEEEYKIASSANEWNRQVPLPDGEVIILHSANAIAHHLRSSSPDAWGNSPQMQQKPRVVKRGLDEFDIPEGEPEVVDHLLFLVHGIGKFCDLKFRPVTEVVDDFRSVSLQLLQSHFRGACEMGNVNRVEVLPVSWHSALHTEDIDRKLHNITLGSIHRLRQFTNDTLLDILFYTSPVFCETIVQAVGNELNRLYKLFLSRNSQFNGGVSLGGHSLGSLILFDMLCNQKPDIPLSSDENNVGASEELQLDKAIVHKTEDSDKKEDANGVDKSKSVHSYNRSLSYVAIGTAGTGQPYISYPQLDFHPKSFFALGSPIGMFVTVRGIDSLGEDFHFPTCPAFYNIFHPFDPVAYRVETLISSNLVNIQPVLIPHHKGRKRMHLELKDTMAHVGAAIKQRLVESIQSTWNTVLNLAMFHKPEDITQEVDKVLDEQMIRQQSTENETSSDYNEHDEIHDSDLELGKLNGGRRIDYVLQEAPLESFNEYIFALSSHVCYWESEDTMLMMLKEIYAPMGITADNQVPQQILPFEVGDRVDGLHQTEHPQYVPLTAPTQPFGMDPTAPPSDSVVVGPPPISGFRRN